MHHFYNIGAEWVSTIICVQLRELVKPHPPSIDGFVLQTYALYFAQTTSPPGISKAIAELVERSIEKPPFVFPREIGRRSGAL
jgi:hypothetical protein